MVGPIKSVGADSLSVGVVNVPSVDLSAAQSTTANILPNQGTFPITANAQFDMMHNELGQGPAPSFYRDKVLNRLSQIWGSLEMEANNYGFHKFLFEVSNFSGISQRMNDVSEDHLPIIERAISKGARVLERAILIARGYTDFYSQVGRGELNLLTRDDMDKIFERGCPHFVEAVAVSSISPDSPFVILFKDGYVG